MQKPFPAWLDGSDSIIRMGSIIRMIEFNKRHVTLKQNFYYELDERYFKYTDEFLVPSKILPAHILEKILNFGDEFDFGSEVDITEEINHELSAL